MYGPRVAISATFTAEPLREPMALFMRLLHWEDMVEFAPFSQVFQTLLDPAGVFARNAGGVNVLLARAEDFTTAESAEQFADAVRSAAGHHDSDLLVRICPSVEPAAELNLDVLAGVPRVTVLDSSEQDRFYPVREIHDQRAQVLGAIPFTEEYFAALAAFLVRSMHRLRTPPFKVIALDCDDTLWSGVCGEDGPAAIQLDAPRRALQVFMAGQRVHGKLLALASKNNEADVLETFRLHPEMPLQLDDFAARRITWEGKAASLQSLADELNLGLGSFVFIDDNPKEVAEVAAELPEAVALLLPSDALEIPTFLDHVWALDAPLTVTAEDRNRTEHYIRHGERAGWERQARNLSEFVEGLRLQVEIEPLGEPQFTRAAQLTQRTNQMNFSTRRRSEAEIRNFLEAGEGLVVSVRDRFGDYGVVGLMLLKVESGELAVDTFLLSCRALGRGVEHRMMRRVGEIAMERGLVEVNTHFEATDRNAPAAEFFRSLQDRSAATLAALFYDPSTTGPHEALRTPQSPRRKDVPSAADYGKIAELRDASEIVRVVRNERHHALPSAIAYEAPRTELERHLCVLWSELLGAATVGIRDNFFDLGGHSLLAVQLVARLHKELDVELPLEAVYTGTLTVAELARAIELFRLGGLEESEYASVLAEIESLSDEEVEVLLAQEMTGESGA